MIGGRQYLLFDVGGALGIAGMCVALVWSIVKHAGQLLYRAGARELSPRSAELFGSVNRKLRYLCGGRLLANLDLQRLLPGAASRHHKINLIQADHAGAPSRPEKSIRSVPGSSVRR